MRVRDKKVEIRKSCGGGAECRLYAAFVERGLDLLYPGGRLGAITSRTGFFLKTFTKWREDILLGMGHLDVVADLGYGVLDKAMVETAAYVVERR